MTSEVFSLFNHSLSRSDSHFIRNFKEQFLRLHLVPDTTVMLSVAQLTEVLSIPIGQIMPIPHMPSWVMGVYNWRGEILWMIDLGHLLGLTPWYQQMMSTSTHKAIVLNAASNHSSHLRGQMLGLVVSQVEDIEWCNSEHIQLPHASAVTPNLAPFLRGYWVKGNGDLIITLDGAAIMAAMPKS